jgi:hypothetical protein
MPLAFQNLERDGWVKAESRKQKCEEARVEENEDVTMSSSIHDLPSFIFAFIRD